MARDTAELLRSAELFSALSDESLRKVTGVARPVRFRRGELIFSEGDRSAGIHVVESGEVRIFRLAVHGKEHVLRMVRPPGSFGEVAAIGGLACPAHAEAVEETRCVRIPPAEMHAILHSDHGFCLEMMGCLVRRVQRFMGLLEDIVLRDATARVARHLLASTGRNGDGSFRLDLRKKDLASHLNLTSETLSRTLRRLVDGSLIDMHDRSFRVLDRPGLDLLTRSWH